MGAEGTGYIVTGQAVYARREKKWISAERTFPPILYDRSGDSGKYGIFNGFLSPVPGESHWFVVGDHSYTVFFSVRTGFWWLIQPRNSATYPYILYSRTASGLGALVNIDDWSLNETQSPVILAQQALTAAGVVWRMVSVNYYFEELQIWGESFGGWNERPGYYREPKKYPLGGIPETLDLFGSPILFPRTGPDGPFDDLERRFLL